MVTAFDIATDEYDAETGRTRTDLTNSVVHFTVEDSAGNTVIQKTSANIAEIEILDQVLPATTVGQARVYFLEADTGALIAGDEYWFDCWAADGTSEEPIVDRGKFIVCESVTHISAGPAPSIPTYPAPQSPQERSFQWTAPSTGSAFTVTVTGGMVDATYGVWVNYEDVAGVVPAQHKVPAATRNAATFDVEFASNLTIGDTVVFLLRDF
ncbi:MAG: hypothetical protein ACTSYX_04580 [Candidatus Thorarchaeota archaeon]